ncbi:MAG TPA: S1/P1 nuclease [Candidatus Eisenbacteria bacterium]|nr:S1/P1 nuclease [Candidatus Eisenbacteria bacterium]
MNIRTHFFRCLILALFATPVVAPPAFAWGCKGHQTVALIAEGHLTPQARQLFETLLKDNPIDPQLKRWCGNFAGSIFADSATWPDDIRGARNNGPWHYIDIPRGAPRAPLSKYCGEAGCVTQAIADQVAILKNAHADPRLRADALRYVIHFVGDLHMPLHATTNNDEGGNCVPVGFFRRKPHDHDGHFTPNLHSLWDTTILERDMQGADPHEYADFLEQAFAGEETAWQSAGIHVENWAWESHDLAERYSYGKLHPKDPVVTPVPVASCKDDNNVGERLMQMHITIGEKYQEAAAPVVQKRLAQAGIRLALILNDAAKSLQ